MTNASAFLPAITEGRTDRQCVISHMYLTPFGSSWNIHEYIFQSTLHHRPFFLLRHHRRHGNQVRFYHSGEQGLTLQTWPEPYRLVSDSLSFFMFFSEHEPQTGRWTLIKIMCLTQAVRLSFSWISLLWKDKTCLIKRTQIWKVCQIYSPNRNIIVAIDAGISRVLNSWQEELVCELGLWWETSVGCVAVVSLSDP